MFDQAKRRPFVINYPITIGEFLHLWQEWIKPMAGDRSSYCMMMQSYLWNDIYPALSKFKAKGYENVELEECRPLQNYIGRMNGFLKPKPDVSGFAAFHFLELLEILDQYAIDFCQKRSA